MSRKCCVQCGRPTADHFTTEREWIGCQPLYPITVTFNGQTFRVETKRDVYRLCAKANKAA